MAKKRQKATLQSARGMRWGKNVIEGLRELFGGKRMNESGKLFSAFREEQKKMETNSDVHYLFLVMYMWGRKLVRFLYEITVTERDEFPTKSRRDVVPLLISKYS